MVLLENVDCLFVIFIVVRLFIPLLCDLLVLVAVGVWLQWVHW
jgi:hypothetical protein